MSKSICTEEEIEKGKKTWNSFRGNFNICVDNEQYDLWNRMKEGANRVEVMRSAFENAQRQLARLTGIEKKIKESVNSKEIKVNELRGKVQRGEAKAAVLNRENDRLNQLEGKQKIVKENLDRATKQLAEQKKAMDKINSENDDLKKKVKTIIDETEAVSNKLLDKIKPFFTFSEEKCSLNLKKCENGHLCLRKENEVGICHTTKGENKRCCTMKEYLRWSSWSKKFDFTDNEKKYANTLFEEIMKSIRMKTNDKTNELMKQLNSLASTQKVNQSRRRSTRRKRRRSKSRKRRKKRGSRSRKRRRRVSRKRSKRGRKRSRKRSKRK